MTVLRRIGTMKRTPPSLVLVGAWLGGLFIVGILMNSQAQEQQFYRIGASTNTVIIGFMQDMILTWSNAAVGGTFSVEHTADLQGAWGSYFYRQGEITGIVQSVRLESLGPCPPAKTGQTNSCRDWDDGYMRAGAPLAGPRFTVQADTNLVVDNLTGLMWARNARATGPTNRNYAIDFCTNFVLAGDSDWRLPTIRELESLTDCSRSSPALPAGHPFTGTGNNRYWSSTPYNNETNKFIYVDFGSGDPWFAVDTAYYVWPVRGGQ